MNAILPEIDKIPGWFTKADQITFSILLEMQSTRGDILEVGVFKGKSAIFLEYFRKFDEILHVCDIFETETNDFENKNEVRTSYFGLNRSDFEKNFLRYHKILPEIHECDSKALSITLNKNEFRFIHIDGSHLYDFVRSDLDFSISRIRATDGVIAIDDFRSAHTPGVAAAMWESINGRELVPIVITSTKAYLANPTNKIRLEFVESQLTKEGLEIEWVHQGETKFLRVVDRFNGFENYRYVFLRNLIPPVIISSLRIFRTFMGKLR
jgi:hypothetical protein